MNAELRPCAPADKIGLPEPLSEAILSITADLWPQLVALAQVLFIDLVLAGDNAIVVGLAVTGLPAEQRRRAILFGIAIATVLRIGFALVTVQLLAIIGLLFAGGLLLLWVCWKMYRELRPSARMKQAQAEGTQQPKTMRQAMMQIVLADLSMSLDNVLAVAGASLEHPWVLVVGLSISVVLMGAAATLVARLLEQYRWLAWVGLVVVLYVALKLLWDGGQDIMDALTVPQR